MREIPALIRYVVLLVEVNLSIGEESLSRYKFEQGLHGSPFRLLKIVSVHTTSTFHECPEYQLFTHARYKMKVPSVSQSEFHLTRTFKNREVQC